MSLSLPRLVGRPLKFRVWNPVKNEWIRFIDAFSPHFLKVAIATSSGSEWIDIKEFPVVQFTGLKDRNGTEIYEGDILREDWGHGETRDYTVEWGEDGWFLIMLGCEKWTIKEAMKEPCESQPRMVYFYHDMIVVGNIFENPNLLK